MTGTQQTDARPTPPRRAGHQPPPAARAAGLVIAITAALAVIALAFALPAVNSAPREVPIGAAGPQAASAQTVDMLERSGRDAFAVTFYPGRAALTQAIARNRTKAAPAMQATARGTKTSLQPCFMMCLLCRSTRGQRGRFRCASGL
ncbi:hypothetical protein [Mycolicibacterium poriferae]|uniref:hypothetical protein n=1 Tax=Mycolicibacterium poriferae TaxID=39694 RepID=UPI00321C0537